jgi:heat shock protein HslJ
MKTVILAWFVLGLLLLSSCVTATVKKELSSTTWEVTQIGSMSLKDRAEADKPTLTFNPEGMKVSGTTGCNAYNGTYTTTQDLVSFGLLAMTKKMCSDMTVEDRFTKTLERVATYQIKGDDIIFFDAASLEVMRGRARQPE